MLTTLLEIGGLILFWLLELGGLVGLVGFVIIENVKGLLGVRTFRGWISSLGSTWIPISALSLLII